MNVTIFAPYQHTEATWAALVLANQLECCGCSVRWAAARTRQTDVHWAWDSRAIGANDAGMCRAMWNADCIVSFLPDKALLDTARWLAPSAKTVLVLGAFPARLEEREVIKSFDHTVLPSRLLLSHFAAVGDPDGRRASWTDWGFMGAIVRRPPAPVRRLLVLVGADQPETVPLLTALADTLPVVRLRLVTLGRLRRREAAKLPDRVVVERFHFRGFAEALRDTDLLLSTHPTAFGGLELEAMAAGVPLLAHDAEPLGSLICGSGCGAVTPCALDVDWLGVQTAALRPAALAALCERVARQTSFTEDCLGGDWGLDDRQDRFTAYWEALLELREPACA